MDKDTEQKILDAYKANLARVQITSMSRGMKTMAAVVLELMEKANSKTKALGAIEEFCNRTLAVEPVLPEVEDTNAKGE